MMVMSGLMIFNAHPRLYWGKYGANFDNAWLEISSHDERGYLRIGPQDVRYDGRARHFGQSGRAARGRPHSPAGRRSRRATILRTGACGTSSSPGCLQSASSPISLISIWNRHLQAEVAPTREELRPSHLWQDIKDHARLRFPTGEAASRYNILQKLSYGAVLLIFLPVMVLTGLCMSRAPIPGCPGLLTFSAAVSRPARSTSSPCGCCSASSWSISRW